MSTSNGASRRGLRQRWFAWFYARSDVVPDDPGLAAIKHKYLSDLHGALLEIGAGTGGNFPYFAPDVRWIGVEPNVFMHDHLRRAAETHGHAPDIRSVPGEHLPVDDASMDVVVASHVLCSVDDQAQVLSEVLRVLKPGGKFAFVEHVAAPEESNLRLIQRLVEPPWRFVGDGCHLSRDTGAVIESAGFSHVAIERFSLPYFVAAPHVAGIAVK
ncbi:MAG: class I SAM-dependent methyltransferase [Anaerolineae bacterium]|nr:class I SAM-dependent methyltransferase [Anaerolineae bacterium]